MYIAKPVYCDSYTIYGNIHVHELSILYGRERDFILFYCSEQNIFYHV